MGATDRALQYDATEHFGKTLHLLWDLDLIQRFLPERQDVLVLIGMLRYADYGTGICTVFISRLAREAGIKHSTQVRRIQRKIVDMGAFWRPEGNKGFRKINGKWVAVFVRSTGKRTLDHALENDLITEEKYREMEEKQVQRDLKREAEEATNGGAGVADAGDDGADYTDPREAANGSRASCHAWQCGQGGGS
jgi:hypothetical protein